MLAPSTHSAHKIQSRVSIDLTGDGAAAAPVALPSATDDEHLLISRVQLEALVTADRWEASALCDFAWVLGRTKAAAAGAGAAAQLGALLGWLPGLLSAAHAVDLRTVAALGLGKLVLHRPDEKDYERSVLAAAGFEAEAVVAELAAVYTEVAAPTVAAQTAVGAPTMMGAIQTFYETLLKERPADVCNSIVFLCLEASDAGRLLPVADAATLRCLQWLASGLPPVDRGVTVDAVRQNLRDGCGVTATEAQVAGWLSR